MFSIFYKIAEGGGGRGLSEMLRRTSTKYQDPICGVTWNFFYPQKKNSPIIYFLAQYQKSSCCEPFEAEQPKRYQNCFFLLF